MELERHLWKEIKFEHGKFLKKFDSPRTMWEECVKYFNWCDSNPMYSAEQLKKALPATVVTIEGKETIIPGETIVEIPRRRPYTKGGLCMYLGVGDNFFRRKTAEHKDDEYAEVFEMVDKVIFEQQYAGAASGFFNGNIVGRMLGLAEKIESKNEVEVKEVFEIGGQSFEL